MSDFASPTKINWQGEGFGQVEFGDDSKQIAIFYWRSVRDDQQSVSQNKPIFKDVPYLRLHPPGERLNIIDRPSTEEDKHRFPRQWNQFVKKQSQIPEGTPLDFLYPNNPAYADMLRGHGIYTIQQLAQLSAHGIDSIGMGAQQAVTKAKTFLQESGDSAALNKLRKEGEEKDRQIKILNDAVAKQKKQIDELFARIGNSFAPTAIDLNPQEPRSYDPQAERINANHPTAELARKGKGKKASKPLELPTTPLNQVVLEPVDEPSEE
jgi:hypothetical protein